MPTKILIDALYLYIKCFIADAITDIFILLIYKILLFMKIRLVDNADENPIADAITVPDTLYQYYVDKQTTNNGMDFHSNSRAIDLSNTAY